MKRIKGIYEEHLRNHENIKSRIKSSDLEKDFYYTTYDWPNNFLINLYFFDSKRYKNFLKDEENYDAESAFDEAIVFVSKIKAQKYLNNDLKKIIIDKLNLKKFDKSNYDVQFIKEKKQKFGVDLNKEEYVELENLLNEKNLTKAQFLRNAIQDLKNS